LLELRSRVVRSADGARRDEAARRGGHDRGLSERKKTYAFLKVSAPI
jgi:hypothetical protein